MQETAAHLQRPAEPVKLLYPVWWMAPFYTGSGESSWFTCMPWQQPRVIALQVTQAGWGLFSTLPEHKQQAIPRS